MEVREENTQGGVGNSSTNEIMPSQKRRPPKLRPAKASKQITPVDNLSEGSQQRQAGRSPRSQLNSLSEYPNSSNDESENSLDSPKLERTPEKPEMNQRTRVRHESAASAEKDRMSVLEREQKSNSPGEQVRETRVRRIISPEVENQEIVRASDAHPTGKGGELLQDGTYSKPGEVVETTEEVTTKKNNDQLKLRLDLNLDIEVELKAKIRGDLTLQLLQ
ncbi:hypothetical protein N7540_002062 [Penicillium herquei]|nr:hypothetical protein N7540_002062 [Penicillium herquei]